VLGDRDALRVLVRNLLDNAVRHVPGGRVDVTVIMAGPAASHHLAVTDDGRHPGR
jgi:signal transduction histidine kinase